MRNELRERAARQQQRHRQAEFRVPGEEWGGVGGSVCECKCVVV